LRSDPSIQASLKTNDEKKANISKAREELDAIDKEKDSEAYSAKMKEIQDLTQDLNDFQDKFSKDNEDLEAKDKEIKDKIVQLKKKLEDAKAKVTEESNQYIGESIADRFRYLMSQKLK
jgi:predicted  nucleic acid-binding Zn-ribbon protein